MPGVSTFTNRRVLRDAGLSWLRNRTWGETGAARRRRKAGVVEVVDLAAAAAHGIRLEVVRLPEAKRDFVLLPRRWVVERSFAWASRFRRLARDDGRLPETVADLHFLAFACVMLHRLVTTVAHTSSHRLGRRRRSRRHGTKLPSRPRYPRSTVPTRISAVRSR